MGKPDIRNFFGVKPKTGGNPVAKVETPKRKNVLSDSDDETENKRTNGHKKETKKRRIIDSDEEDTVSSKPTTNVVKKPNLSKLKEKPKGKEVDLGNAFGKSPVKRVEKEIRKKPVVAIEIPSDDEFEKSLIHMEEEVLETPKPSKSKDKTPKKKEKPSSKTPEKEAPSKSPRPKKQTSPQPEKREKSSERMTESSKPPSKKTKPSPKKEETSKSEQITNGHSKSPSKTKATVPETPPPAKKPSSSAKKSSSIAKKDQPPADLETSVQMDEERHERRQMNAILYQKYKNRTSVINPGCKPIPEGRPNCLAGKVFLVTGILESLERSEAEELIKKYGGKVSSGVTKKLNFMVTGEEAGPAKIAKAEEYGVKQISEDDLLEMIESSLGGERKKKKEVEIKQESQAKKSPKSQEKKSKTPEKKKAIKEEPEEEFQTFSVKKKLKLEVDDEPTPGPSKATKVEEQKDQITPSCDVKNLAWVDKYKPTSIKQIIGQQGAASNTNKLLTWLTNWHSNHDGKKKLVKPSPWAKNGDGAYFKAALLSGPPGIGKTTTATLVCKELGYDTVEFNASDTRSKRLLKEQVSELLKNKSLYGYMHGNEKQVSSRHVLLMDEVDGMAGNEDRGGIQELIGLIKESSIPIICMCNDRNHQKMRSLVNYCFDLRFQRPRMEQIKGAMMSVCFREQMKVDPKAIEEIITASNNDIRQTINYLAMLSAGKDIPKKEGEVADRSNVMKKDLKIGPWEVVRKVFSAEEHKKMSLNDKADLFFQDYSMGPLFVQENYLQVSPAGSKGDLMAKVAKAASSLSRGDLIERRIRSNNNWSVLPVQAMFSSVIPGEFMSGHVTGQINFPGWLGKNSKRTKRSRLAQEIHDHTRVATSGSRTSIRMDYAPYLLAAIVRPLKDEGLEGVPKALEVMREYRISREDIDGLIELTTWPGMKNPMDAVESKVKAALTRAYNKEALAFVPAAKKKSKAAEGEEDFLEDEDAAPASDDEDDDKIDNDALIKQKKKTSDTKAESSKPKEKKEKKEPKEKKETTKKAAKKK